MIKAIHSLNNGGALKVYAWDGLKYLLISDSVAASKEKEGLSKIQKLSIAPLLFEAVARALHIESISTILDVKLGETDK